MPNPLVQVNYKGKPFRARVPALQLEAAKKAVAELKDRGRKEELSLEAFREAFRSAVSPFQEVADVPTRDLERADAKDASPVQEAADVPGSDAQRADAKAASPALRVSYKRTAFRARVADGEAASARIELRELVRSARQKDVSIADFEEEFYGMATRRGATLDSEGDTVRLLVKLACGSFQTQRILRSFEHRARQVLRQLEESAVARGWSIDEAKCEVACKMAGFRLQPVHDPEEKVRLRFCYREGTFLCPRVGTFGVTSWAPFLAGRARFCV